VWCVCVGVCGEKERKPKPSKEGRRNHGGDETLFSGLMPDARWYDERSLQGAVTAEKVEKKYGGSM
jgi:hypothetical protein